MKWRAQPDQKSRFLKQMRKRSTSAPLFLLAQTKNKD
jgi:hypothetical protein